MKRFLYTEEAGAGAPDENCTHDCSSCGANCPSRSQGKESFLEDPNPDARVKRVIGVVSGKGGVGKSLVTSLLAVASAKAGKRTGIMDADVTGPSIPAMFGLYGKADAVETGLLPAVSESGIRVMSINLILDEPEDPVVWRGPIIAGVVKQFWTEVCWGDIDTLFVDMPPGTGDVPLTVFQSLPVDGIVVVTSPQDLVSMVVEKAVRMAEMMDIPVLGVVENMSYLTCPDCGRKIQVFGESGIGKVALAHGIGNTLTLPIMPEIAARCDAGRIEDADASVVEEVSAFLSRF